MRFGREDRQRMKACLKRVFLLATDKIHKNCTTEHMITNQATSLLLHSLEKQQQQILNFKFLNIAIQTLKTKMIH